MAGEGSTLRPPFSSTVIRTLHGSSGTSDTPCRAGISSRRAVTRGYAPTDLAPDDSYFVADQAKDILALHDALYGDERAVLVGHDWGRGRNLDRCRLGAAPLRQVRRSCGPTGLHASQAAHHAEGRFTGAAANASQQVLPLQPATRCGAGLDRIIPKLWRDWSPEYDATDDLDRVFGSLTGLGCRRAALKHCRDNLLKGAPVLFAQRPMAPALYLHGANDGCRQAELVET